MKRRCVFLDRDGVVNVKATPGEYIRNWQEFQLIPAVVDWIRLFNVLDFLVVVVTNQRGVARQLVRAADLTEIHHNMVEQLAREGARIDDVFCCPHEENSCDCRKPRPGLVLEAAKKWNIDIARSLMIGDSDSDGELAENCGMSFVRVHGGRIKQILELPVAEVST